MMERSGELISAIRSESHALTTLEGVADVRFDTTSWSPHMLSRAMEDAFAWGGINRKLHVTITSFGFKHGQLRPADSLYDVRFLRNPHFDPKLKRKTGLNSEIDEYLRQDERALDFLQRLVDLHTWLLPSYFAEGKHYFRIGIGCTGGKHRSVWLAERLGYGLLACQLPQVAVSIAHRDLGPHLLEPSSETSLRK
jgi:RNase adapter protein RapZ